MVEPSGRTGRNRLVSAFPHAVSLRLAEHLEPVTLPHGLVLGHPSDPEDHVYFPDCGVVSMVKIMQDGRTAEVGSVGIEGMVGVDVLVGLSPPAFETVVQVDGYGRRVRSELLRQEVEKSSELKALVLRYMSYWESQIGQTAACNRLHSLRQRCCRWMLTACDNTEASTFTLTHEFLALMMGVNRPTLSLILAALQRRGIIEYHRASLTIRNRAGLENGSCECYAALRADAETVVRPQSGKPASRPSATRP